MKDQFNRHHGVKTTLCVVGDVVYAYVFNKNVWLWKPATVIKRQGIVAYDVILTDGVEWNGDFAERSNCSGNQDFIWNCTWIKHTSELESNSSKEVQCNDPNVTHLARISNPLEWTSLVTPVKEASEFRMHITADFR